MTRDNRYTVEIMPDTTLTTGRPLFAAMFCGRVIGLGASTAACWELCAEHQDDRLAPRTRGVMQASRISSARISQGVQHG